MPQAEFPRLNPTLLEEVVRYGAFMRGLEQSEIYSREKRAEVSHPRFGIIWALRQVNPQLYSYPYLRDKLGFTDHTSVIHGFNRAAMLRDKKKNFRRFTDRLVLFAEARLNERKARVEATTEELAA